MKHTSGPWNACHDGKCSCKQVWGENHPIAIVESGEWGDEYAALRLTDDEGISGTHAEAYMERIAYGSIKEEVAIANARLIAKAPTMYEFISEIFERKLLPDGYMKLADILLEQDSGGGR